MTGKRLETETYEEYKERMKKEASDINALLAGTIVEPGPLVCRKQVRTIPHGHTVILAKCAELAGDSLPLSSLQLLYLRTPKNEREKLINGLIVENEKENELEETINGNAETQGE
jgi:hypothetical protein